MDFDVVAEIASPWEKEEIPNQAQLFMRVHKNHFDPDGQIRLIAFRNHGQEGNPSIEPGMSTDWEKYSTPEECRQRATLSGKSPENYAVIVLPVGEVREIPGQRVEHTPIYEPNAVPPILNRAHTDVFGEKDEQARLTLMQISRIALALRSQES
jgi:hypothetical protein